MVDHVRVSAPRRARRALTLSAVALTLSVSAVAAQPRAAIAPPTRPQAATSSASTPGAPAAFAANVGVPPAPVALPAPAVSRLALPVPARAASLPFRIGFARKSVDPRPDEIASGQLHLGGYGLGPTRATTGPLVDGDGTVEHIYARAMAITNQRGQTLLLGALENQGTFAAYKQGAYGLWDVRQQVAADLARAGVTPDMIVVNSDHSHAGPDLIGLWGGVPISYLRYVHDQLVAALEEAYRTAVPARLAVGGDVPVMPDAVAGGYLPGSATMGEPFVHSQFGPDPATGYPDQAVDTELRVLQAYDAAGRPLGTLINYAAHATVMGSRNVRYSADWPGRVAEATAAALGEPVALTMVADVGRSQPPRPNSDGACDSTGHVSCDVDRLDTWTRLFTPWVVTAVHGAVTVRGDRIGNREVFTREAATNAALLGVSYSGEVPVRGYGAYRSTLPPWASGDVIGTFASAHRIGDVLLTANPGEAYPDVRMAVAAARKGMQAVFTFGLANDQLGYLIAPSSEYGWIAVSQPGNDNAFFNVSTAYGDHLACTLTAASGAIGFGATRNTQPYGPHAPAPACPVLTPTDAVPIGPTPQQPWPFGDGLALPPPFPQ